MNRIIDIEAIKNVKARCEMDVDHLEGFLAKNAETMTAEQTTHHKKLIDDAWFRFSVIEELLEELEH